MRNLQDLEQLIANSVREGPSRDYKRELALDPPKARVEAMKDLSGMGNGGGGTILVGIDEDPPGVPKTIVPITDHSLPTRLEDIVRSTIRPPLLATYQRIDVPGGFALSIDVMRSPLGPYMVEGLGQRRFFVRIGQSTEPMSEQQVRDAYFLAARGREGRAGVWATHNLPIQHHTANPWLLISAVPEEPLTDVIHLAQLPQFGAFTPPEPIRAYADYSWSPPVFSRLEVWGDGLYWEYPQPQQRFFRVHRDGAVGWGTELTNELHVEQLVVIVHAQLLYLGWLWDTIPLRTPIELRIELPQLAKAILVPPFRHALVGLPAKQPVVVPSAVAAYRTELLPSDLVRAPVRHRVLREVLDRVYQVFGQPHAEDYLFQWGWLYGQSRDLAGGFLAPGNIVSVTGDSLARVCEDGGVDRVRDGALIGFVDGGVLLDLKGRAIAATRYALGSGLPDSFLPNPREGEVPRSAAHTRAASPEGRSAPGSIAEWSSSQFADVLPRT